MKTMRSWRGAIAVALLLGSTTLGATQGVADEDSENRNVPEFTRVVIEGSMDLVITAGEDQSVRIETDSDYLSRVETNVSGDTLYISQEGRRWRNNEIFVEISVKKIEGLGIEGAADVEIYNIDSDTFELNIDGAGDVTLEGTCGDAVFEINGAGDLDAEDLKCKTVDIQINGAGDADLYASESVIAELNGVGDIEVCGDPDRVRPRIHGLGSFEVRDDC